MSKNKGGREVRKPKQPKKPKPVADSSRMSLNTSRDAKKAT